MVPSLQKQVIVMSLGLELDDNLIFNKKMRGNCGLGHLFLKAGNIKFKYLKNTQLL